MADKFEEIAALKGTRLNGVFFPKDGLPIGPGTIVEADEVARTVTFKHDSGRIDIVQFDPEPAEK
jgi:hypothetical protein